MITKRGNDVHAGRLDLGGRLSDGGLGGGGGGGGGGSVVGGGGGGGTRTEPREVDLIPEYQCLPGIDCRENGKSPNS